MCHPTAINTSPNTGSNASVLPTAKVNKGNSERGIEPAPRERMHPRIIKPIRKLYIATPPAKYFIGVTNIRSVFRKCLNEQEIHSRKKNTEYHGYIGDNIGGESEHRENRFR